YLRRARRRPRGRVEPGRRHHRRGRAGSQLPRTGDRTLENRHARRSGGVGGAVARPLRADPRGSQQAGAWVGAAGRGRALAQTISMTMDDRRSTIGLLYRSSSIARTELTPYLGIYWSTPSAVQVYRQCFDRNHGIRRRIPYHLFVVRTFG